VGTGPLRLTSAAPAREMRAGGAGMGDGFEQRIAKTLMGFQFINPNDPSGENRILAKGLLRCRPPRRAGHRGRRQEGHPGADRLSRVTGRGSDERTGRVAEAIPS